MNLANRKFRRKKKQKQYRQWQKAMAI